ncbi:unnamed protein product [Thelazia callipaeda]|uniref:Uncharacterized protein n=1 Tax=Thelazia callipaeda TaxID=103827 RepID=A0A0N5CY61_THECL|nr:unnamed protein product [Thelazia callipaeda]
MADQYETLGPEKLDRRSFMCAGIPQLSINLFQRYLKTPAVGSVAAGNDKEMNKMNCAQETILNRKEADHDQVKINQ